MMKKRTVSRKRESIIVGKAINVPLQHLDENGQLRSYDSIRHHITENGWLRAEVSPVSPFSPVNGVNGNSKQISTHKFTIFKNDTYDITHDILWMDGAFPRLMEITKIMDHQENRRKIHLYACEKLSGEAAFQGQISSYGNKTENLSGFY